MPVIIPKGLEAGPILRAEGLEVIEREGKMPEGDRESVQVAILNLMPTKEATETQLLRAIGSSQRTVEVTLLTPETHESKNASPEHMQRFYTTFPQIKNRRTDGLIVTGAPLEMLEFEEVDYWRELCAIMDHARAKIRSTYYICWAAQAALYRFYGIGKHPLEEKCFGVFEHSCSAEHPLLRGMDRRFWAPHSRHTTVFADDIRGRNGLELLAQSAEAGAYLAAEADGRSVFVTGHSEYDADTLKKEYDRDSAKGLPIGLPAHYFPDDDPVKAPEAYWRGHSRQLYGSWIENILCR